MVSASVLTHMQTYYVYILASLSRVLYIGMTNDLERRILEHKEKVNEGFTARYAVSRLVYYEQYDSILDAITREKQIKGWKRVKKEALIRSINEKWKDLSAGWYQ